MTLPSPGFHLHRASRTERLADALAEGLARWQPDAVLAPQRVVVAHPGLGRWLLQFLAARRGREGSHGIAANILFELPGAWLARLMAELLDDPELASGPWQRELLRWVVHEALPDCAAPELRRFLEGAADGRRRMQLADHLAGLFTQYLVYRRDWILAAERGGTDHWQAGLWRDVRDRIEAPHRAGRMQALLAALDAGRVPQDTAPLHLFGLNHLPPDTLKVLALLARQRAIHLYFPDPCPFGYWHDVVSAGEFARRVAEDTVGYREVGHPLLAALGRHGQVFASAVSTLAEELAQHGHGGIDRVHEAEPGDAPASSLLQALQDSVRTLEPQRLAAFRPSATDASLRVHACHTRLRELEVLRDALLAQLADDPSLHPRDIVVMAPDIGAYAPLLPAVFGSGEVVAGERGQLPWQLADRSLDGLHPLLAAFSELLAVPSLRLTRSQVLGLLDQPPVARALGLSGAERASIETWLARARVHWGLDEEMKAAFAGAAERRHSFAHGRDRLMLGWYMDEDVEAFAGIGPVAGVAGGEATALGRLDALLALLAEAREVTAGTRSASDWSEWLQDWLGRLLSPDPADPAAAAAMKQVMVVAAQLRTQPELAGVDPLLDWEAVRAALSAQLGEVPAAQRFLLGGITFCGMVPARVIPFRVACLLGLDDGAFPREPGAPALNLMQQAPRHGDRDPRGEDRYLFLESLMAARQALHLSYRGESPSDGTRRNPAAPLAELMEFLDAATGVDQLPDGERDGARCWLLRHALQPFDGRYYDGRDARLWSYASAYAAAAPAAAPRPPRPFMARAPGAAATAGKDLPVSLKGLQQLLRDPPRVALERGLKLDLSALEHDDDGDREPLDDSLDRREVLPRTLLLRLLAEGARSPPAQAPAWLEASGRLPPGLPGERQYAVAAQHAGAALQCLAEALPWLPGTPATPRALRLALPDGRLLEGIATRVHDAGGACAVLDARLDGAANLSTLLSLFVEWAALWLAAPADAAPPLPVLVCSSRDARGRVSASLDPRPQRWMVEGDAAAQRADLGRRLARLVTLAQDLEANPRWLPPGTTWAWLTAPADKRLQLARQAWRNDQGGEHRFRPHAVLAARGLDPLAPGTPEHARFAADAELLRELLRLETP